MAKILSPAARWLPGSVAVFLADAIGWVLLLGPTGKARRRQFQQVFAEGPHRTWTTAHASITRPLRDHVAARRCILHRPGNTSELRNVEFEVPPSTRALIDGDQPFLMANGHFSREALMAAFAAKTMPGRRIAFVANPVPDPDGTAATERVRLQFDELRNSGRHVNPECHPVTRGPQGMVRALLASLEQPGQMVSIHVDAPIGASKPALQRPFAGYAERGFANGTARIARLAQVPIVVLVNYVDRDGTIHLEYSEPIEPPERSDGDADNEVTSAILDTLEVAIGRHPDSYVIDIGWERRWDPHAERWIGNDGTAV